MAEDDDDEAFGDFAFAPIQSNSLFTVSNPSATPADEDEDDEWGDFVQPPSHLKPSGAAVNGDHRSDHSASPATWIVPRGALPLSLFGDAEEEEVVADDLAVPRNLNPEKSYGIAEGVNLGFVGNGVSNSKSFSIADLYDSYSQIKHESRGGSDLAGKDDSVDNGVYSSTNQNAAGSAVPELKNVNLSNALVVSDHNQLANKSGALVVSDEFNVKSYMSDPSKEADLFGGWNGGFNGFSSNLKPSTENVLMLSLGSDMNGEKQQLDNSNTASDDDGDGEWDFKDADSEFRAQDVKNNVGAMVLSESSPYSSGTGISSMKPVDLFGTSNGSIDFFASSTEPVDFFAKSGGISTASQDVDLIGISNLATLNGFTSDEHSLMEQNNVSGLLGYTTDVGTEIEELDEDFGDFSAASVETGPEPKEKDTNLKNQKGAIPLSIFGDEEPETGSSSDGQDLFFHQSIPAKRSDHKASSVHSINDMISNLYSQAEQTSSKKTDHDLTESQLNPSSVVSSSDLVGDGGGDDDDDDDDDDNSWDFKDASEMRFDGEASLTSTVIPYGSKSSKLKLDNYLDFYSKLKEELCFVMKHHIDRLKNAQGDAELLVEGARASSFDSEFQLFCNEPEHMEFLYEEGALQDHHTRDSHLPELTQVLLEPQFQKLDSEYHLSQKLLIVEKDLGSFMELTRHTNAMLKILSIGTLDEQKVYVSLWSEMISICAQELRHGASIWKDVVVKHVQSQFLSEPQGRNFILALGEIYRVVIVLGASAILFKPWILSGSVDSPSFYILLEECRALWSSSGLEEALSSVLAPTILDDTSLFRSIKHIHGLDVLELENYVCAEKESRCHLSLLTAGVVPDLKIVMWGNEQCFVTLANLWANLMSCNPPRLPQLKFG